MCQSPEISSTTDSIDMLTELPKDVVLRILSLFTTKEVRRISVISKNWNTWLLGYYPKINLEASRSFKMSWFDIRNNDDELAKGRSSFVKLADGYMKRHLDSSIDEFRVAFDLDCACQSHVDRWVNFALAKRVKTLDLEFQPFYHRLDINDRCGLNVKGVNHSLTSLSLSFVNVTSDDIETLIFSFPFLENLTMTYCEILTSVKISAPLFKLKSLDISRCYELKTIDISAPKMVYFRYLGQPIELNIRNAVSLSSLFIGGEPTEDITYAFEHLSTYLPQLEALYLRIPIPFIGHQDRYGIEQLQFSLLPKLTVLELGIIGNQTSTLLGWAPLVEACPSLEKLTVKLDGYDSGVDWTILDSRQSASPLRSLTTLELLGYTGRRMDIEFAGYIFDNATNLREVIVEVKSESYKRETPVPPFRITKLKEMLPQGVAFILIDSGLNRTL